MTVPTTPLIVTLDVECDYDPRWRARRPMTFTNVLDVLPSRLAPLLARLGVRPTYFISPEVLSHAPCTAVLAAQDAELASHLHGEYMAPNVPNWDFSGTAPRDMQGRYPEALERAKLETLTELFKLVFGRAPRSHRAGRFGIGKATGRILLDLGYHVDSSISPHVGWRHEDGSTWPDFTGAIERPYRIERSGDLRRSGDAGLLEVPVTILAPKHASGEPRWFRPWYSDRVALAEIVSEVMATPGEAGWTRPLVMMFHSQELVPGASPYAQTEAEVRRVLDDVERTLEAALARGARPMTLEDMHDAGFAADASGTDVVQPEVVSVEARRAPTAGLLSADPARVERILEQCGAPAWFSYSFKDRANRPEMMNACRWITDNVDRDAAVLETGCGVGFNLLALAEQGFHRLSGTDIDAAAIGAGRHLATSAGVAVDFEVADGLRPATSRSGPFKVVLALNWTMLVEGFELDAFLNSHAPSLTDDGVVILDAVDRSYDRHPKSRWLTSDWPEPEHRRRQSEYRTRLDADEVHAAAARCGFAVREVFHHGEVVPRRLWVLERVRQTVGVPTRGSLPRVLMIADVPNWIFERHARTLARRLADRFDFEIAYRDGFFDEADHDLIYPLEWNLVPLERVQNPEKWVTGIRSHISWSHLDPVAFGRALDAKFAAVHVVSRRLLEELSPHLGGLEYLSHGVDLEHFSRRTVRPAIPGRLVVGWAGNRKSPAKGFERFIQPLANVAGVELRFCGYSDRNLSMAEMRAFYEGLDAYVCSSSSEGNNNGVMEAAAMGCAVVTTAVGTVDEWLTDDVNALIVPRDASALASAVAALRDDPRRRARLGSAARQAVSARWSWQTCAADHARWFERALSRILT